MLDDYTEVYKMPKNMKPLPDFLERIKSRPLIFDGAMGTMIYQRGVFLNVCYDDLCLTQPTLIQNIHREYVEAGAEAIETNSFGANRIKLEPYGIADRVADINKTAVRLALEAAAGKAYVGGSAGPCLAQGKKLTKSNKGKIEKAFDEQIRILSEAGAHFIQLETFHDLEELQLAASIARRYGRPVMASFTIPPDLSTEETEKHEKIFAEALDKDKNVDVIGVNCGRGPAELFHPVRNILKLTSKPVVAMPNAGGPREISGRMLYLNSPEYFTEFAKRFIELGVKGIGGCCGTTPAHIRMASKAIKTMSGVKVHVSIANTAANNEAAKTQLQSIKTVPFSEKSSFAAKLAKGRKVTLVEMFPPQTMAGLPGFLEKCKTCEKAGVDAINLPDGPRASARMSVMATAFAIKGATGIEPLPHYCCRDRNLIGMQSDLLGGFALGLKTWLFITGDPPKMGLYPDATGVFDLDSIGLSKLADNLNHGFDAAGQVIGAPTAIAIGVGANPVAIEMELEISRFFKKIDAGAEFAITQPVFAVDALLRFIERANKHPRPIPIMAGIFPLLSFKNADFMSKHVPGVIVPQAILDRMQRCKTKEDGIKTGIDIARETCERIKSAVAGFQIAAPLGKTDVALEVLK